MSGRWQVYIKHTMLHRATLFKKKALLHRATLVIN